MHPSKKYFKGNLSPEHERRFSNRGQMQLSMSYQYQVLISIWPEQDLLLGPSDRDCALRYQMGSQAGWWACTYLEDSPSNTPIHYYLVVTGQDLSNPIGRSLLVWHKSNLALSARKQTAIFHSGLSSGGHQCTWQVKWYKSKIHEMVTIMDTMRRSPASLGVKAYIGRASVAPLPNNPGLDWMASNCAVFCAF